MTMVPVPIDERWAASRGLAHEELEEELRLVLAAKLYELRRVTLGQAAGIAGLTLWNFCDALPKLGVSVVNSTDEQLLDDLR
ncbi:MAG: UPF0175 family protein [Opitutaceae bacterium]|nr:UPF0175 family protein [Opitutaceae bacterium]